jgi:8-oxo-dGTP pyrophosphatase MutT (NUDIX family)
MCQQTALDMQIATLASELKTFIGFRCCLSCSTLLVLFDMASLGPGNHIVVVLYYYVGGSKAPGMKLVLHRDPRTRKSWFLVGSIWPHEAPVDVALRELIEETGLTATVDDLTSSLSGNLVRVPLPAVQNKLVYVFSASVHVPYVVANLRTLAKVEHDVNAHSNVHPDGSYVVPTTVGIDGLSLTPLKVGLVKETRRKL